MTTLAPARAAAPRSERSSRGQARAARLGCAVPQRAGLLRPGDRGAHPRSRGSAGHPGRSRSRLHARTRCEPTGAAPGQPVRRHLVVHGCRRPPWSACTTISPWARPTALFALSASSPSCGCSARSGGAATCSCCGATAFTSGRSSDPSSRGALVAPGKAFSFDGRLSGVIWPVPATQVAHYAAVLLGSSVVLWMCRVITGRNAAVTVAIMGMVLVATHTRTALLAGVAGLVCASASLLLARSRARRTWLFGALTSVAATAIFASGLTAWLLRNQTPSRGGRAHRADQGLVSGVRPSAHVDGDPVRLGNVEPVVRGAADRQQLGRHLPRPRVVRNRGRGRDLVGAADLGAEATIGTWPRRRDPADRLLHVRAHHRDGSQQSDTVPARPRRRLGMSCTSRFGARHLDGPRRRARGAEGARPRDRRPSRRLGCARPRHLEPRPDFVLGIMVARELSAARVRRVRAGLRHLQLHHQRYPQGPSTDPLIVRFSGEPRERWRPAAGAALGTSLSAGVGAAVLCLFVGLAIGGDIGSGFIALAVGLPGILLQDSYRFAFFSRGQGHRAFLNDLVWGILQTATLRRPGDHRPPHHRLEPVGFRRYGDGRGGFRLAGRLPIAPHVGMVPGRGWSSSARWAPGTSSRTSASAAHGSSAWWRWASSAGLASVAEVRAAEILMGPFIALLAGVSQVSVPEARVVLSDAPRRLIRLSSHWRVSRARARWCGPSSS